MLPRVLPHCTLETCDGTCRPVTVAFLNFWNTDESDYYSDVSTAIEHINKKLEFAHLYLVKKKNAQPVDDESNDTDTCESCLTVLSKRAMEHAGRS